MIDGLPSKPFSAVTLLPTDAGYDRAKWSGIHDFPHLPAASSWATSIFLNGIRPTYCLFASLLVRISQARSRKGALAPSVVITTLSS
jgi:hypothetical protein